MYLHWLRFQYSFSPGKLLWIFQNFHPGVHVQIVRYMYNVLPLMGYLFTDSSIASDHILKLMSIRVKVKISSGIFSAFTVIDRAMMTIISIVPAIPLHPHPIHPSLHPSPYPPQSPPLTLSTPVSTPHPIHPSLHPSPYPPQSPPLTLSTPVSEIMQQSLIQNRLQAHYKFELNSPG